MAGEVALSPSQVRRNGQWEPIRRTVGPRYRSLLPLPCPSRQPAHVSALGRRPLPNIHEDKALSLKSASTSSLKVKPIPSYQPSTWSRSSEHLIIIKPSPQLQLFQSVSGSSIEGAHLSRPRKHQTLIRPESYVPSGIPIVHTINEISKCIACGAEATHQRLLA